MKTTRMYRYLGRNGIITSPILVDPTAPIPMFSLTASEGKILTDGTKQVYSTLVFEDELNNWTEINDPGQR
jgi:hypothetical protein